MNGLSQNLGLGFQRRMEPSAVAPARAVPYRVAVYGDSFAQRAQDILGSPNSLDGGAVNPVTFKWATDLTSRVGGFSWGAASWVGALSRGKYGVSYRHNRGVGGSNSGQCNQDGGTTTDRLSVMKTLITDEASAGRAIDAVILHVGTNDCVTAFTETQSYNNIKNICAEIVARGPSVVLHTILPRGNDTFPDIRIDGTGTAVAVDRRSYCDTLNAMLVADLHLESTLLGKVHVVDPRAAFAASGGRANDIDPALAYDGLHLGPDGCRILAQSIMTGLDAACPISVASQLAAAIDDPTNFLGTAGTFQGSGGTVSGGYSGTVPAGWHVGGMSGWSNTLVPGTKTVSTVAADVGNAVQVTVAASTSSTANANTVSTEIRHDVTLPGTLGVGDWFEALVEIEIDDPVNFRGADLELRLTEPDAVTRTVRAHQPPPNGTALLEWSGSAEYTGVGALVLRTPARARKSGTYGTIQLAAVLHFAGQKSSIGGTFKVKRAIVRKVES